MAARKPLPVDLIDALLADYKKPDDLICEEGLLKQLTKPSSNEPSMPRLIILAIQSMLLSQIPLTIRGTVRAAKPSKVISSNFP